MFRDYNSPDAIDLVDKLLRYNPVDRLTPCEAMAHKFFDNLRDPNTRLPNGEPQTHTHTHKSGDFQVDIVVLFYAVVLFCLHHVSLLWAFIQGSNPLLILFCFFLRPVGASLPELFNFSEGEFKSAGPLAESILPTKVYEKLSTLYGSSEEGMPSQTEPKSS